MAPGSHKAHLKNENWISKLIKKGKIQDADNDEVD
jgi:hypothetical protein